MISLIFRFYLFQPYHRGPSSGSQGSYALLHRDEVLEYGPFHSLLTFEQLVGYLAPPRRGLFMVPYRCKHRSNVCICDGEFPIGSNAIYISTALFRSADPSSPHITCKRRMRSAHPDCRSVSHYLAYGAWRILERAAKPSLTIYPFWCLYPRPSSPRVHPLSAPE